MAIFMLSKLYGLPDERVKPQATLKVTKKDDYTPCQLKAALDLKENTAFAQLVETVFEAKVEIVQTDNVQPESGSIQHSVVEHRNGRVGMVHITPIRKRIGKEPEWNAVEILVFEWGGQGEVQYFFPEGGFRQNKQRPIDHIIIQPPQIIFAIAQGPLVEKRLIEGQLDSAGELKGPIPFVFQRQVFAPVGFNRQQVQLARPAESALDHIQISRGALERIGRIVDVDVPEEIRQVGEPNGIGAVAKISGVIRLPKDGICNGSVVQTDAEKMPAQNAFAVTVTEAGNKVVAHKAAGFVEELFVVGRSAVIHFPGLRIPRSENETFGEFFAAVRLLIGERNVAGIAIQQVHPKHIALACEIEMHKLHPVIHPAQIAFLVYQPFVQITVYRLKLRNRINVPAFLQLYADINHGCALVNRIDVNRMKQGGIVHLLSGQFQSFAELAEGDAVAGFELYFAENDVQPCFVVAGYFDFSDDGLAGILYWNLLGKGFSETACKQTQQKDFERQRR